MCVPLLNCNHNFICNTLSWREDLGKDHKQVCAACLEDLCWQLTVFVLLVGVLVLSTSFSLATQCFWRTID